MSILMVVEIMRHQITFCIFGTVDIPMFDLRKFIALIAIENRLMQIFFDKAEAAGLEPNFDVYHVLSGQEKPKELEIEIMKHIFEFNVKGTAYEKDNLDADIKFHERIVEKNNMRHRVSKDNTHFNN